MALPLEFNVGTVLRKRYLWPMFVADKGDNTQKRYSKRFLVEAKMNTLQRSYLFTEEL